MELTVFNYTGQPLMLFTSKNYYNRQYIKSNMPGISQLLASIRDQSWLSSLEGSIYADKVDHLVSSIKGLLSPQLEYQDFILAGDVTFLNNIFEVPNFLYCVGITSRESKLGRSKLSLTFNMFDTKNILSKYDSAEDLVSSIKLYLGYQSQFYCDSVTPDGSPVCNAPLPKSSEFINHMYALRHNPRLMQVDSPTPVGTNFDKSMIENVNITDHVIIKSPDIANSIPAAGMVDQTVVAYLFFDSDAKTAVADSDFKQSFNIDQTPNPWASIALLLIILLIVAIVVGVIMYISKNGGSINIFSGKGEKTQPPIMI